MVAIPQTGRLLADRLARQVHSALDFALGLVALGVTRLRCVAFPCGGIHAEWFGAKQSAEGLVAVDLALGIIRFWAARLAFRDVAFGLAVLVAGRLLALPLALGHAVLLVAGPMVETKMTNFF